MQDITDAINVKWSTSFVPTSFAITKPTPGGLPAARTTTGHPLEQPPTMYLHLFTSTGIPSYRLQDTSRLHPEDAAQVVAAIQTDGIVTGVGYLSQYKDLRGIPVRPDRTINLELMPRLLRGTSLIAYLQGLTAQV